MSWLSRLFHQHSDLPKIMAEAEQWMSGERFLARRGFADSRNYSASELGPLLDEFGREKYKAGLDAAAELCNERRKQHDLALQKERTMAGRTIENATADEDNELRQLILALKGKP